MRKRLFYLYFISILGTNGIGCSCSDNKNNNNSNPDSGLKTDALVTGTSGDCEKQCTNLSPFLCVPKNGGACVECTTDDHCKNNSSAKGPKCDIQTNTCYCEAAQDCSQNTRGTQCTLYGDSELKGCQCTKDEDCQEAPYTKCLAGANNLKRCELSCSSDKDCTDAANPRCDTTNGVCKPCLDNSDCTNHPFGGSCLTQGCACKSELDCKGSKVLGSSCVHMLDLGEICGCVNDNQCSGNVWGPTCALVYKSCSCTKNEDCKSEPYTLCGLAFAQAGFLRCQKPCTSNADCNSTLTCDTTTGKCVECKGDENCSEDYPACMLSIGACVKCQEDKHCTEQAQPVCHKDTGQCVECTDNKHCSGDKPLCDKTQWQCVECISTDDCKDNVRGTGCVQGMCGCTDSNQCQAATVFGSQCITLPDGTLCGCTSDEHCSTNQSGPHCYAGIGLDDSGVKLSINRCSCLSDAQCTGTNNKCALQSNENISHYAYCQKSCTGDEDCKNKTGLPTCNTTLGKCVECTTDPECANNYPSRPYCHPTFGRCAECVSDNECAGKTPYCSPLGKCISCKETQHCAGQEYDKSCDPLFGCVECESDSQCGPNSRGSKCDITLRHCYCEESKDCASNNNGHWCDTDRMLCHCEDNDDCPEGRDCVGEVGGDKFCK